MTPPTPEGLFPLDPLMVCKLKFEEAYRFALNGAHLRSINGIEVAPFVGANQSRRYFYILQRPTLDEARAGSMPYYVAEFSFKRGANWVTGDMADAEMSLNDFLVTDSCEVLEILGVPTINDGRVDLLSDGSFNISHLDMRKVAEGVTNGELFASSLDSPEKNNLLSRLVLAVPVDK